MNWAMVPGILFAKQEFPISRPCFVAPVELNIPLLFFFALSIPGISNFLYRTNIIYTCPIVKSMFTLIMVYYKKKNVYLVIRQFQTHISINWYQFPIDYYQVSRISIRYALTSMQINLFVVNPRVTHVTQTSSIHLRKINFLFIFVAKD